MIFETAKHPANEPHTLMGTGLYNQPGSVATIVCLLNRLVA